MKHRAWIVFSGILWFCIGISLLYKGLYLISEAAVPSSERQASFLIAIGLMIGFLKGRFVFVKTVRRVVSRIAALELPIRIREVYAPAYWILIGSMMLFGMLFRFLPISNEIRGVIDVAIGSALMHGSFLYFRAAGKFKQIFQNKSLLLIFLLASSLVNATSYLEDLEELGYCVIPVISQAETELLYQRVWHEYIEKAWPACKMDERGSWKETFPIHNKLGIFAGPAGQTQVMWDLRQDPRIVEVFAKIWGTNELIVSMDGMSLMCPAEIREEHFAPWPHVDQGINKRNDGVIHNNLPPADFVSESMLKVKPFTIQGQFLFEDSFEGDGGFFCIPKSHLRFEEFSPFFEELQAIDIPKSEKAAIKDRYLRDFFSDSGDSYPMKHVTAPKGSLILWDSRTIHWNQHPKNGNSKVRMVGYLCYVPKKRMTDELRALRLKAFELGVSTGHNPAQFDLKFTKDHIWKGYEQYLESSSYRQPDIHLTPLGKSLLGLYTSNLKSGKFFKEAPKISVWSE
jgi:ectoine hydroxylase-related dioxygenase (phytanoyl-CoA dioxygenase family)